MMSAKDDNEYIDLAKVDLNIFAGYSGSFAERLANYCFHDNTIAFHRREISQEEYEKLKISDSSYPANPFDTFHSANGYVPDIRDAQKWSLGVMKNISFIGSTPFLNQMQRFFHIQNNILTKIKSGEMSGEKARETAAGAFSKIKGWEVGDVIFDGEPDSEEWLASQITDSFVELSCIQENIEDYFTHGFDLSKYNQHMCEDRYFKPYENMDEILESIRSEYDDSILKAFKIGFLYHDAWWKARHEEAARKHYEMLDRNKTNGKEGGGAKTRKQRDKVLKGLALDLHSQNFLSNREDTAISQIIKLARQHDVDTGENLFKRAGIELSRKWFSSWYDDFLTILEKIKHNKNNTL